MSSTLFVLVMLTLSTINSTVGKDCQLGIPTETISSCFSISSDPDEVGNECAKDDSCSVLVAFNSLSNDQGNTTSSVRVTITIDRLTNGTRIPIEEPWVILDIAVNKARVDNKYIRLECSNSTVNAAWQQDVDSVAINITAHDKTNLTTLTCEYEITPTEKEADRKFTSFDPRNLHYLQLIYGHELDGNVTVDDRIISDDTYKFAEDEGAAVTIPPSTEAPLPSRRTRRRPRSSTALAPAASGTGSNSFPIGILIPCLIGFAMFSVVAFLTFNAKKKPDNALPVTSDGPMAPVTVIDEVVTIDVIDKVDKVDKVDSVVAVIEEDYKELKLDEGYPKSTMMLEEDDNSLSSLPSLNYN